MELLEILWLRVHSTCEQTLQQKVASPDSSSTILNTIQYFYAMLIK